MSRTTTIDDIEVNYVKKGQMELKIKGTPDEVCRLLQQINNNNLKLNSEK